MIKYPKISAPFMRDIEGTKRLIEGCYIYEEIAYISDNEWIGTEKIDGTNIGVVWDGHKVSFQGRTERAVIPAHLLDKLNELFGGNENEELFEQLFGEREVIFFGEGYGNKIQGCGSLYRSDVSFILFDVYFPKNDKWLGREKATQIAQMFGIEIVPIVFRGTLPEAIEFIKSHPKSTIGSAYMEGIVCKPSTELRDSFGNRIITKVKYCDFKE